MDTGCTIVVERMLRSSTLLRGLASKAAGAGKKPTVVFVDGARIPFAQSSTMYNDYLGVDLQKFAYKGLVDKTALDPKEIDYILGGNGKPEARGGGEIVLACILKDQALSIIITSPLNDNHEFSCSGLVQ